MKLDELKMLLKLKYKENILKIGWGIYGFGK